MESYSAWLDSVAPLGPKTVHGGWNIPQSFQSPSMHASMQAQEVTWSGVALMEERALTQRKENPWDEEADGKL